MKISLRPVIPQDRPFLVALYAETRQRELAMIDWPDEQKTAFCEMQFDAQDTYYRQTCPTETFQLILGDGQQIGRLYVAEYDESINITDVIVSPEQRNQGIGTRLMLDVLQRAREARKPVTLQVDKESAAQRLYERLGFQLAGDAGFSWHMRWTP